MLAGEAQNAFNDGVKLYKAAKFKDAVVAFNRALKAAPKSDEAYNNRGLAYFKLGQIDSAIKDYDEALKLNPKLTDAYFNRGNAHLARITTTARSKITTRSSRTMPKRRELIASAASPILRLKQFDNAIQDFNQAQKLDPKDADIYYGRGSRLSPSR